MKYIAFICKFPWIGISTSVINSAFFWESKGYLVDIYCENPDTTKFPLPAFAEKKISFIITNLPARFILDDFLFRLKIFKSNRYEWVIGFDHSGIIRGMIATTFSRTKLIYHSLEFFETESKNFRSRIMKYLEKLSATKSKYVFTQDEYRINFLADQLRIDKRNFKLIYNSGYGLQVKKNLDYFRNSFNIPDQKRIMLCVGSLIKEHYIIDLINTIENWRENFVLVLHGWIPDKTVADFIKIKSQLYPQRLFLSENLFSTEEKEIIFQSCDIGFVGFLPNNNNLKFAAGSAGKLFDFLKAGKPIIAYNTPGMFELIEANGVGFVFNDPSEISAILEKINMDYENLSQNANKTFPQYDFMSQYESVYADID